MTIEERSTEVPGLVSDNNSATNASTITSSIAQSGTFNRRGRGRENNAVVDTKEEVDIIAI